MKEPKLTPQFLKLYDFTREIEKQRERTVERAFEEAIQLAQTEWDAVLILGMRRHERVVDVFGDLDLTHFEALGMLDQAAHTLRHVPPREEDEDA